MEKYYDTGWIIAIVIVICLVSWGMFVLTKNFSYWIFYEDMVKETVRQLVKPEYLLLLK